MRRRAGGNVQQHGRRAKECVKACQVREHDLVVDYDCAGGEF